MVGQGERSVLLLTQVERILCRSGVCEASSVIEPSISAVVLWFQGFDRALEEGSKKWFLRGEVGAGGLSVPGWRVHRFLDRMFFGKTYSKIHPNMDSAVVVLGRRHRVFFHDPLRVCAIAEQSYPGDPNAIASGNMHILIDQVCSTYPSVKKMLENMERFDREKRRKIGKQAPRMDDTLAKVFSDLKKIEEIKKLHEYFYSR